MFVDFRQANLDDVPKIVTLVNSAYRGASSKKGWTTEADLLDGQRVDAKMISEMIERKNSLIWLALEEIEIEEDDLNEAADLPDQKILGCVHLEKQEDSLYLGLLTVDPNLQTKGLGSQLIEEAEIIAEDFECKKIKMTVISSRKELIAFYERRDFISTKKIEPFPLNDPKFGLPRVQNLEFVVLEKMI